MALTSTKVASLSRIRAALNAPVDIAWLAAFRILFGLVMAFSAVRFLAYNWIDRFFVNPTFHFKYWGFGWVPAPTHTAAYVVFTCMAILAGAVAAGALFRFTAPLFALLLLYTQLIDVATYLNHYYLAVLLAFLLALSPAHRAWSVDALLFKRPALTFVRKGWLWLFRAQVGIVYVFAGLAKAQPDWLLSAQPLRTWLSSLTDLPWLGPLFSLNISAPLMSWAGFLFDSTIVIWLSWRRTRLAAYAVVIVFHALTRVLFPIGMFPVIMVLSALVFFEPSWPRTLLGTFKRRTPRVSDDSQSVCSSPWRGLAVACALGFVAVQLFLPMRHLLYGGNVLWGEQGMRFSWRVMVREKNGSLTYLVTQPATGRTWEVSPRKYLSPVQQTEMSTQPDLILQLAHHIRDEFSSRGLGPVEVRAEAIVSLNGRAGRHLIDPHADLARIEDGLGQAPWITPPPKDAIPTIRTLKRL